MKHILLLNGPNLNLLGQREPDVYGSETLADIENRLQRTAVSLGYQFTYLQYNSEEKCITALHNAKTQKVDILLMNPAAFTHTSIALRDAVLAVAIPFIEIHLSNIAQRESFRHNSYFSDIALGVVSGFGNLSYDLALQAAHHFLHKEKQD